MEQKGSKKIGIWGAAFLGVGSMVGAGIFALLGEAGTVAGSAVWLSFLIAGVIALLQGYSFAKLAAKFPSRGGPIEFFVQGFGNGHITGVNSWLFYFTSLIVGSMVAVSFGSYASALFFGEDAAPEVAKLLSLFIVVLMAWLNLETGQAVARVQKLIVWTVIAILGGFAFITIRNANFALLSPSLYPPATDIIASVALTFFAFLGFSIVAFAGESVENPGKNVPRALYLSLVITTVLYVAIAIGVFGMLPLEQVIAAGDTAIAEAAKPILGSAGFVIMTISACFSTASAVNSSNFGSTGLSAHLAKIGQFPKVFGKKIGQDGNTGTIISAVIVSLLAVFLDLSAIASVGSCVALISFLMIGVAHLRLVKKTKASRWLLYLGMITVLVTLVVFAFTSLSSQPQVVVMLVVLIIASLVIDRFWRSIGFLK